MKDTVRTAMTVAACVGAAALGGSAIANAASSSTTSTTATNSTAASTAAPAADNSGPPAQRTDETRQTGDLLAKLSKEALAKVPGGTILRVETDGDGSAYEAHVTRKDGSLATVKFDKSGAVTAVLDGMGGGGHGGPDTTAGGPQA